MWDYGTVILLYIYKKNIATLPSWAQREIQTYGDEVMEFWFPTS